ncbi:MAG TPA: c-type cytochrome [Burkholderiaceae bacterium]|nr:c-type cytochrome [Burkholderiaceae bacterium]
MKTNNTLASFFPAPLLRIAVAAVPIAVVCYFVAGLHDQTAAAGTMTHEAIAERLHPVAYLAVAAQAAGAGVSAALKTGKAVYEETCGACHGEGIAGAPKVGDKKAWRARIAQGFDTLVKHAIDGYTGKDGTMPPKGGGGFEDLEVARAVAYMADKSGASFSEPANLSKK